MCASVAHGSLVTPKHVESSWTRDWIRVSCMEGGFLTARPPGKSFFLVFKTLSFNLTSGIAFFVFFCVFLFCDGFFFFFIEWI